MLFNIILGTGVALSILLSAHPASTVELEDRVKDAFTPLQSLWIRLLLQWIYSLSDHSITAVTMHTKNPSHWILTMEKMPMFGFRTIVGILFMPNLLWAIFPQLIFQSKKGLKKQQK